MRTFLLSIVAVLTALGFSSNAFAKSNAQFGFMNWNTAEFEEAVANGDRVIVSVWATWCPSCRAQRKTLSALLDGGDYGDVKVFGVEFDDPTAPQMIGSHSILPGDPYATKTTLIFFNGGEQVDVYQGQSDAMMAAILNVDI